MLRSMRRSAPLLRFAFVAALALAGIATASAQHALYVEHNHQMKLVRSARGERPCIDENGRLVPVAGPRYALAPADEYLPVFVAVSDFRVSSKFARDIDDGSDFNSMFEFVADFDTAYTLGDVFVVLEFSQPSGVASYFVREIGELAPNRTRGRRFQVLLDHPLTDYQYTFHLFVGGAEVLHSLMSEEDREAALAKMVARRLARRPDGPPAPFVGPPPVYPPKFASTRTRGHSVVRIHVLPTGAVTDVALVAATDPAFGEAALASMRQWRFLPRLKDGHPIDAVVNVPVDFAPPSPAEPAAPR